jgi:hypothetical protein
VALVGILLVTDTLELVISLVCYAGGWRIILFLIILANKKLFLKRCFAKYLNITYYIIMTNYISRNIFTLLHMFKLVVRVKRSFLKLSLSSMQDNQNQYSNVLGVY